MFVFEMQVGTGLFGQTAGRNAENYENHIIPDAGCQVRNGRNLNNLQISSELLAKQTEKV